LDISIFPAPFAHPIQIEMIPKPVLTLQSLRAIL